MRRTFLALLAWTLRSLLCFTAAFFSTIPLFRTIGEDVLYLSLPVNLCKMMMLTFYPEVILDGETGLDVMFFDIVFFYTLLFLLLYLGAVILWRRCRKAHGLRA